MRSRVLNERGCGSHGSRKMGRDNRPQATFTSVLDVVSKQAGVADERRKGFYMRMLFMVTLFCENVSLFIPPRSLAI